MRKLLSVQREGWATLSLTAFPMPAMDWVSKCPSRGNHPSGRCLYKRKIWDKQLKWMGLQNLPDFTLIGSCIQSCHRWCVVHELHINVVMQPGLSKSWAIYAHEAEHVFWRLSGRPWCQVCSRQLTFWVQRWCLLHPRHVGCLSLLTHDFWLAAAAQVTDWWEGDQYRILKSLCSRSTQIEVSGMCHVFFWMSWVGIWIS